MTQTFIFIVVITTKLSVTAQRISTLRNTRRDNRSPTPAELAEHPLDEVDVQRDKKPDECQDRVIGVGPCVAAVRVPRAALVGRRRGWRGIIPPSHWSGPPSSHWSGGGGDAARRSDSHNERNERLVKHHCEDWW